MTIIDPLIFNLLSFLAVIGILVTVHEYGHYIVGKLFGVKVLCFSVGFGRPIYKYKSKRVIKLNIGYPLFLWVVMFSFWIVGMMRFSLRK